MLWFRKKAESPPAEKSEAELAKERAQEALQRVQSQETEVNARVGRLEWRSKRNNFGPSLEIAMEARAR
jgi:hypothetical protein